MGVDIHAYVECDFQNTRVPFSSPDSIRCINSGEFFVWRDFELFHVLGLDYHGLDLPESPIKLGKIPDVLSWNIIQRHSLVLSPHVSKRDSTGQFVKFPLSICTDWQANQLQCFVIKNHRDYGMELLPDEILLFDPGCELPSFALPAELHQAVETCQPSGKKIDYFMAIVALIDSMAKSLSAQHVRLVYWFDSLGEAFMREYRLKHGVADHWLLVHPGLDDSIE